MRQVPPSPTSSYQPWARISVFMASTVPALAIKAREAIRIENLANYQMEALKQTQPTGTYILGGVFLGALLALEVAQRLQAAGEDVRGVLALDPITTSAEVQKSLSGRAARRVKPDQAERIRATAKALEQYRIPLFKNRRSQSSKTTIVLPKASESEANKLWNDLVPGAISNLSMLRLARS
ncbi:hypothetical protein F4779DRAFT_218222 [Xylariaceae sp. FL0662B]|nr:hypothetical protein F4779DRAFT_218222 [Xylariaceae sp. FL0662B]